MRVLLAFRPSLLCGACSSFDSFYRTSAAKREVMTRKFHFYRSLPNKINCSEDGWSLRVVSLCFLRTTSKSYLTSEVSLLRVLLCCVDVCCKMMTETVGTACGYSLVRVVSSHSTPTPLDDHPFYPFFLHFV